MIKMLSIDNLNIVYWLNEMQQIELNWNWNEIEMKWNWNKIKIKWIEMKLKWNWNKIKYYQMNWQFKIK